MKTMRDFYNRTAAEWADRWYADDSMQPLLRAFLSRLPHHPRILDLCCGAGYESMRMASLGAQVIGLDLSEESISIARKRNPSLPFFIGDMLQDYSHIGQVDGIACIAGLVHLPEEKLRPAFVCMADVLAPGCLALFVVREGRGKLTERSYTVIDSEEYDRDFYGHSLAGICAQSEGIFEFIEELLPEEGSPWKNYVFRRI